jgi:hypothetical protein
VGRIITSLTLRPETLQLLDKIVLRARGQDDFAEHLGLHSDAMVKPDAIETNLNLDAEGLSPKNCATLTQMLGSPPITGANVIERINQALGGGRGGEERALEALHYLNTSRKANLKALRRVEALRKRLLDKTATIRKSSINNSRVVEALILIGAESLENACNSERSSKSGVRQSGDVGEAARKLVNRSSRQTNAARAGKRAVSAAA